MKMTPEWRAASLVITKQIADEPGLTDEELAKLTRKDVGDMISILETKIAILATAVHELLHDGIEA